MPTWDRRGLRVLALALCGLAASASAGLAAAPADMLPPPIPRGRALDALAAHPTVLLAVEPGLEAERLIAGQGGTLVSRDLGIWRIGGGASARLVPELDSRRLLRYAEPSRTRFLASHMDQGDPLIERAWFLDRIGAADIEPPGPGVSITIIDTGLDVNHPDFAERPNLSLLNEQPPVDFRDNLYHGTFVASTAGAAANGVGSVGVYPTSSLRIFKLATLDDPDIIVALDSAARGDVVNLSIGGPGYSRSLYEGVMRAVDRGALVVTAAGNHFGVGNPDIYPADYPHVITVAATDQANRPLFFSSGNPAVDLAAPGADIPVQDPTDPEDFVLVDGTSFAAPIVSAVAAWVWTKRPNLDRSQVFELLRRSADDIAKPGFDPRTGYGLVDLPAALLANPPVRDAGEPNDDVDLITPGKVLANGEPPLTSKNRRNATVQARLTGVEDPRDVYRVFVAAGKTIEIRVAPDNPISAFLWKQKTSTVVGPKSKPAENRLASSTRPGMQAELIRYRNTASSGVTLFVELRIPGGGGGDSTGYTLRVRTL
jgi:subtilisin family serine protease